MSTWVFNIWGRNLVSMTSPFLNSFILSRWRKVGSFSALFERLQSTKGFDSVNSTPAFWFKREIVLGGSRHVIWPPGLHKRIEATGWSQISFTSLLVFGRMSSNLESHGKSLPVQTNCATKMLHLKVGNRFEPACCWVFSWIQDGLGLEWFYCRSMEILLKQYGIMGF